ncbi:hypothetical protein [Streptosporangium saharense]|uniref:Uncharacterized protein n=1 Tax=Streptosporangium saharense TaxID=1706840 RepID=A0A7W7VQN4_9ACTN|nr:hypothetical protein [Streptosporangium saharense]MBB4919227.1 hypothetical protein [Streptosporangium saharense]
MAPVASAALAEPYGLDFAPVHDGPDTPIGDTPRRTGAVSGARGAHRAS